MDHSLFERASPFIILVLSWMFSASSMKLFFVSLPLSVIALRLYHPGSGVAQALLLLLWLALLAGNVGIVAFSADNVKKPALVHVSQILAAAGIGGAACWRLGFTDAGSATVMSETLSRFLVVFGFSWWAIAGLATYVVAPLFVLEKNAMTVPLESYHVEQVGTYRYREWRFFVRFAGDPARYRVGKRQFNRFRAGIGRPFTYVKYRGLFNLVYIKDVALANTPPAPLP